MMRLRRNEICHVNDTINGTVSKKLCLAQCTNHIHITLSTIVMFDEVQFYFCYINIYMYIKKKYL